MKNGDIIFGTDGFRGPYTEEAGEAVLNPETIYRLSLACLKYIESTTDIRTVVIARDPRASGEVLSAEALKAAKAAGFTALHLEICPTPATFKISEQQNCAAIMITASHNPHTDNGWKAAIRGDKLTKEQAAQVSQLYWDAIDEPISDSCLGDQKPNPELQQSYITAVIEDIESAYGKNPLEDKVLVFDGANGATAQFTPVILRALGATVHEFATDHSQLINHGCGAAHLEGVIEFLRAHPEIASAPSFLGALSADGDGDRIMMVGVDPSGQPVEIDGNHSLYAMAQGEQGIVGTIYTNTAVKQKLEQEGIGFEFCANGDSAVTAALVAKQKEGQAWTRGGEATGHLVDTNWLSSGDGVRMGAWLACFATKQGQTFYELSQTVELWPQVKKTVHLSSANRFAENQTSIDTQVNELNKTLGEEGRVIVRKSGTEPLVRIWGEALPGAHDIQRIIDDVTEFVKTNV